VSPRAPTVVRRKLADYRRKRDFGRTSEPSGDRPPATGRRARRELAFVIQKHAASHLHFDFRLELDGVMKSWAVPKGPSLDPAVKRLAMEVEDHPIDYNTFEGTIPKGEYGGGTVMLWDRGTYTADEPGADGDAAALRRGYDQGKLAFTLHGDRLRGSWALVRTRGPDRTKPQWLLIKHRDEFARPGSDIVAEETTSVDTGRTMDEIATGKSRVWHSDRGTRDAGRGTRRPSERSINGRPTGRSSPSRPASRIPRPALRPASLSPMLASIGTSVPEGDGWAFEPKYDGIRVLAFATAKTVKLMTRNGKDKAKQFPEVADALRRLASRSRRPYVLDGEIVALGGSGPARFQQLQSRMHVKDSKAIAEHVEQQPAALIAFDLLVDGTDGLVHEPWSTRRARLEKRLRAHRSPQLQLSEVERGSGAKMLEQARATGWEGIIAKRVDSVYLPGVRSDAWLKLKVELRQEFVVGGYTEPRNTREHIGALLLGYFDRGRFLYVGHTGGGFTRAGLKEMRDRLRGLERKTSPFEETPKTNERAHWVRPEVVVEVKFSEWTADGKLRQPIYLGTRDDKDAREVGVEPLSLQGKTRRPPVAARATTSTRKRAARGRAPASRFDVVAQLDLIERRGGEGTLRIDARTTLDVSSLEKVFFPAEGYTKGDVMRYYARVAPYIVPAMADRPLVLKRFPNGIDGKSFYQQNAPDRVPDGVRVETITNEEGAEQQRIVGGNLATLLYTVQLGSISVDPWHSRVRSLDDADYTILDLDPGPRARFDRVVEVALWVKAELDALELRSVVKTSGASGLHVVVPLPPRTSNETALVLAQLVATRVAKAHPRQATVERSVKARPPGAVYVDYLQNIRSKTVAGVYCVRAKPGATVSTPLEWAELTPRVDPREHTIVTVPGRIAKKGDIWGRVMKRGNPPRALRALGNL
jgi:bifunctional non-homologous end joining protein LigD